jgi:hypothetical protein
MRSTIASGLGLTLAAVVFSGVALAQTAPAPTPAPAPAAAPPLPRLSVSLFEKGEIDRSKGCSFVLWQHDRDPEKDRFAYIFAETLARNHVRENARIKVGNEVLTFRRVAVGGAKEFGYKTFPNALYKAEKDDSYLILEMKPEDSPGEVVDVDSGTLTIIRPRHVPFVATVKGNAGCNTPAAAPTPAPRAAAPAPAPQQAARNAPLVPPKTFERYSPRATDIPANMRAEAVKFGCDGNAFRQGAIGYSLSEESAVWELNCQKYAPNVQSKVFALVYTLDPKAQYTFQKFDIPKGENHQGSPQELLAPVWDMRTKIITSTYTEGNGSDCGTFQRHQLTEEGTFVLIEYRSKSTCDGKSMKPSEFPLIYRR